MQETFLYSVNPRKVITGIEGVGPIRTPKSLYLTKEDVKLCLSKGTVYRRFSLEGRNERVTIANVDRLHNSTYISEEEWKTKQEHPYFISDGVLDEEEWKRQSCKVLFVLKEANWENANADSGFNGFNGIKNYSKALFDVFSYHELTVQTLHKEP